jgi:hypothetical protein
MLVTLGLTRAQPAQEVPSPTPEVGAQAQAAPSAPALAAAPPPVSPQLRAAAGCPVAVQYTVNLGQGQDFAAVPIFVATMAVLNNDKNNVRLQGRRAWGMHRRQLLPLAPRRAEKCSLHALRAQVTVDTWRMRWRFPYTSVIRSKQDVFDPGVELLTPGSATPVVQAVGEGPVLARPIASGQPLQFGFLGTKGTGEAQS